MTNYSFSISDKPNSTNVRLIKVYGRQNLSCHLCPLQDTLLYGVALHARIEADLGNPPNKVNNQRTESLNLFDKESLNNSFTDQTTVHELIYEKVITRQENYIVKEI